jgi:hypothetical protein
MLVQRRARGATRTTASAGACTGPPRGPHGRGCSRRGNRFRESRRSCFGLNTGGCPVHCARPLGCRVISHIARSHWQRRDPGIARGSSTATLWRLPSATHPWHVAVAESIRRTSPSMCRCTIIARRRPSRPRITARSSFRRAMAAQRPSSGGPVLNQRDTPECKAGTFASPAPGSAARALARERATARPAQSTAGRRSVFTDAALLCRGPTRKGCGRLFGRPIDVVSS